MDAMAQTIQGMLASLSAEDLHTAKKFIQFLLENRTKVETTPLNSVEQGKDDAIAELRSLCHPGKHVWTENPADYVRRMRDADESLP